MQSQTQGYEISGYKETEPGDQADDTILKSCQSIYTAITEDLYSSPFSGQIELLIPLAQPDTIILQADIQHPLSISRIHLTSGDIFVSPVLDPADFRNNVNLERRSEKSTSDFIRCAALDLSLVEPIHQQTKTPQTTIGIHSSSPHHPLNSILPFLELLYLYLSRRCRHSFYFAFMGERM
ncbi:hypothetical protein K435DRAFT_864852 [Dendrothele bispora CBS 962.96]|uniref:Uncharacterized protein n=1 Tax=Dendrothele bispora (strain CBS 962.96) TaxID=1314807 RepID=A0A4S8LL47_DENBC|nr:hypothetical protein K435DRAFT_864852 [Dendrothele bispora CBS 962.96]